MKRRRNIFLGLILFCILFLSISKNTEAQSPESFNLITQRTLPGDSKYPLKRFKEKTTEFLKFTHKSRSTYQQELLAKRLSELISLKNSKNVNEFPNATQRFAYQAGKLADDSYNDSSDDKSKIIKIFDYYKPTLEKMRDNFPSNSPHWLLSQHDINTLSILTDRLK